jgi:hypothetical protein
MRVQVDFDFAKLLSYSCIYLIMLPVLHMHRVERFFSSRQLDQGDLLAVIACTKLCMLLILVGEKECCLSWHSTKA